MYRIYYAGKKSKITEGVVRDDFTNKIIDLTFGWDFFCEQGHTLDLNETHTFVAVTKKTDLEEIFRTWQGDFMSEAWADMIRRTDASHISMSVGDVLVNEETGKILFCDRFGWTEVN